MLKALAVLIFFSFTAGAQNLSPEEQRQLLNDVKEMKEKVNKLEGQKSAPTGLKRVNYENETSEKKEDTSTSGAAPSASLSEADSKKLQEELEIIKRKQAESQKILDQMDKDE